MPRPAKTNLSAETVRSLMNYDPSTGQFTSLVDSGINGRHKAGRVIGSDMTHGYRALYIKGSHYLAHRIAWLYVTGEWPSGEIDHIDLNRANNAFTNLREASHAENTRNHPGHHTEGSGRLKGATPHFGGRWKAQIMLNRRQVHLGLFATQEAAHAAYLQASNRLHAEYGRAGKQ